MLVFVLYLLVLWVVLVVRTFMKMTFSIPADVARSIDNADPLCLARMLQNSASSLTSYEALLVVSANPSLLRTYKWASPEPFITLHHSALQCEKVRPARPVELKPLPVVVERPVVVVADPTLVPPTELERQITTQVFLESDAAEVLHGLADVEESVPSVPDDPPVKKNRKTKRKQSGPVS